MSVMFEQNSHPPSTDLDAPLVDADTAVAHPSARVEMLAAALAELTPAERLVHIRNSVDGRIVFTHGFGVEGQLLFHWICEHDIDIDVVTLDTGRLFPETYTLWAETERRYGRRIRAVYPQHENVEALVEKFGINGFYQ